VAALRDCLTAIHNLVRSDFLGLAAAGKKQLVAATVRKVWALADTAPWITSECTSLVGEIISGLATGVRPSQKEHWIFRVKAGDLLLERDFLSNEVPPASAAEQLLQRLQRSNSQLDRDPKSTTDLGAGEPGDWVHVEPAHGGGERELPPATSQRSEPRSRRKQIGLFGCVNHSRAAAATLRCARLIWSSIQQHR
jgi:hypothetical protein